MNIAEVHKMFRSVAQQQGMQTVRAILPEDIDIHLNNAIINKVRSIIQGNVTDGYTMRLRNGKSYGVISPLNSISVINALRTLNRTIKASVVDNGNHTRYQPFTHSLTSDVNSNIMLYLSTSIYYSANESYKCRFIDVDELENTFNDYCNAPSDKYPIATINHDTNSTDIISIYTNSDRTIKYVEVRYIKQPAVVNSSTTNPVNPDIPDYLIPEIVTIAVNEYFTSIGSTNQNIN